MLTLRKASVNYCWCQANHWQDNLPFIFCGILFWGLYVISCKTYWTVSKQLTANCEFAGQLSPSESIIKNPDSKTVAVQDPAHISFYSGGMDLTQTWFSYGLSGSLLADLWPSYGLLVAVGQMNGCVTFLLRGNWLCWINAGLIGP